MGQLKKHTSSSRSPVFVTGNANKLKEVKAILAAGESGIEVTSQAVDGKSASPSLIFLADIALAVPEVQGTTQEVAIAKCCAAAEQVDYVVFSLESALGR